MTTPSESQVARQVRTWFHQAWDPELPLLEWRERLVDSGWAVPSWSPDWFGRGLPAWADRVAHETIRAARGVGVPLGGGFGLAAPTLYDHGSPELKARFLRPTLTGELRWCQLFSEPEAGSDLAGLKTTAVRDGDDWIINGQKVWNTSAQHADLAILVARTDWDAVKHAGLSYFVLDMNQDGVETRPITQMNYHRSFNEVFLTDARIPHTNMVGRAGDGWKVARGTLAHERRYAGRGVPRLDQESKGRLISEARTEAEDHAKIYAWYPQRQGRVDLLVGRAQAAKVDNSPLIRQQIVSALSTHQTAAWTAARAKERQELGRPPGSEGSIGKLALSEVARASAAAHSSIAGPYAMLASSDDEDHAVVAEILISTPAQSIAGGTDEIQHNIVAENILGLPKEPSLERGIPFKDVGRSKL